MAIRTRKHPQGHISFFKPKLRSKLLDDDGYGDLEPEERRKVQRCISLLSVGQRRMFRIVVNCNHSEVTRADIAVMLERPKQQLNPHDISLLDLLEETALLIKRYDAGYTYTVPRLVREAWDDMQQQRRAEQEREARERQRAIQTAQRQAELDAQRPAREAELAQRQERERRRAEAERKEAARRAAMTPEERQLDDHRYSDFETATHVYTWNDAKNLHTRRKKTTLERIRAVLPFNTDI